MHFCNGMVWDLVAPRGNFGERRPRCPACSCSPACLGLPFSPLWTADAWELSSTIVALEALLGVPRHPIVMYRSYLGMWYEVSLPAQEHSLQAGMHSFFFKMKLYFASVEHNRGRSHVPFIQFPSMVTSCKTIVKYDNQDIHTDNQDTGRFQHYVHSSSCPFKATPTAYLTPFLSTWQQPVCSLFPQCLSFQDCYINKIINQMNFLGVEFLHSHISHVHPGGFMYQYLVPF